MKKLEYWLHRIFSDTPKDFHIRFWDGSIMNLGSDTSSFTLVFRSKPSFKKLIMNPNSYTVGTAYIHGDFDIEGDIFAAISLMDHFESFRLSPWEKIQLLLLIWRL